MPPIGFLGRVTSVEGEHECGWIDWRLPSPDLRWFYNFAR